jgi:hypothetical protein
MNRLDESDFWRTPFLRALYNLSKDPSVSMILETGTLDGTGATKCIVDGIEESGSGRLITIEAMKDSYEAVSRSIAQMLYHHAIEIELPCPWVTTLGDFPDTNRQSRT